MQWNLTKTRSSGSKNAIETISNGETMIDTNSPIFFNYFVYYQNFWIFCSTRLGVLRAGTLGTTANQWCHCSQQSYRLCSRSGFTLLKWVCCNVFRLKKKTGYVCLMFSMTNPWCLKPASLRKTLSIIRHFFFVLVCEIRFIDFHTF